jgi:hypothetical protein
VKFILRLKLVDVKSSHDLIIIYFVHHHFFYDLCFFLSFCGCNKMARWQQELIDGIVQALENETTTNLVFGALMLQVPNLHQHVRRQHGGSFLGRSPNVARKCKVSHNQIV